MTESRDGFALDQWYAVERGAAIAPGKPRRTRLLGRDIVVERGPDGGLLAREVDPRGGPLRPLPVQARYGHVWTTLGLPARDLFDMPEFEEEGRRLITCGAVTVRTSGLRIVENFLDLAHFPFVHAGILGAEPNTEVMAYKVEFREDVGELWALDCGFHQPRAAAAANAGQDVAYSYRVAQPFSAILYKSSPGGQGAFDVIGIFVQPREEDLCDVHSFILVFDEVNSDIDLLHFQQTIFLQDRIILENQRPRLLPLVASAELSARADAASIAYRRWLREKGLRFGVLREAAGA